MQISSQSLPAMGQTDQSSAPMFGAEAEKHTLNKLVETHGEHASVPGAPANATFSSQPVTTTMDMKAGSDALIGNAFENDAGDTVYLRGFQDAEQASAVGTSGGANKSEGIAFGNDNQAIRKTQPAVLEKQEEPSASEASTSSNSMEDVLKFLVSLLASLFGNSSSSSDTSDTANSQTESNSSNIS